MAVDTVVTGTVVVQTILISNNLRKRICEYFLVISVLDLKVLVKSLPAALPLQWEQLASDSCCTFLLFPLSSNPCKTVSLQPLKSFYQDLVRMVIVRIVLLFKPFPHWQHKKHAG